MRSSARRVALTVVFLLVSGMLTVVPGVKAAKRAGDRIPGRFIVELARGATLADAKAIARDNGGRVTDVFDGLRAFAFAGPDAAGGRLRLDRRVRGVESDTLVEAQGKLGHLSRTRATAARAAGYTGAGVTIAIIDTGVLARHKAFDKGQVRSGHSCVGGGVKDQEGHGTASASNAAGKIGVARNAQIIPVRVFSGASLFTPISKVICGLNWVKKANRATPGAIDVVNLSLAYAGGSKALQRAVNAVRSTGATVVAAAGNNGGATMAPARYKSVIAVSALAAKRSMAYFSAVGGDLTAPGVNIYSAENNGGYSRRSGTSRSAPMVAGAAAVVLAAADDPMTVPIETLTPDQIYSILRTTGTCPSGSRNGSTGFCPGRWKGDDKQAEPLINVQCAALLADPVAADCA